MITQRNRCFAHLPEHVREASRPHLILKEIPKGVPLTSLVREPTLFFPITCVLAITATSTDERGSFLRFAGSGVAVGLQPGRHWQDVRSEAVVCGAGYILSVPSEIAWGLLSSPVALAESHFKLMRAIANRALIASFCVSNHSVVQRLATMLVAAEAEYGRGMPISLSQEELARHMFVCRETIAVFLAEWSAAGVIETGRSKISIKNRDFLLGNACRCHASAASLVEAEFSSWADLSWKEKPSFDASLSGLRRLK